VLRFGRRDGKEERAEKGILEFGPSPDARRLAPVGAALRGWPG